MIVAVDFDGTCVCSDYPRIGQDIGAVPVLRAMVRDGARLILYTMRSGEALDEAQQWFRDNRVPLYAVQRNPTQRHWTDSPKCHADLFIDDRALGCPLIVSPDGTSFVDWEEVNRIWVRLYREDCWGARDRREEGRRKVKPRKPPSR